MGPEGGPLTGLVVTGKRSRGKKRCTYSGQNLVLFVALKQSCVRKLCTYYLTGAQRWASGE